MSSSRESRRCRSSFSTAKAVNCFDIDPILKRVAVVIGMWFSRFARPNAPCWITAPLETTTQVIPGASGLFHIPSTRAIPSFVGVIAAFALTSAKAEMPRTHTKQKWPVMRRRKRLNKSNENCETFIPAALQAGSITGDSLVQVHEPRAVVEGRGKVFASAGRIVASFSTPVWSAA